MMISTFSDALDESIPAFLQALLLNLELDDRSLQLRLPAHHLRDGVVDVLQRLQTPLVLLDPQLVMVDAFCVLAYLFFELDVPLIQDQKGLLLLLDLHLQGFDPVLLRQLHLR